MDSSDVFMLANLGFDLSGVPIKPVSRETLLLDLEIVSGNGKNRPDATKQVQTIVNRIGIVAPLQMSEADEVFCFLVAAFINSSDAYSPPNPRVLKMIASLGCSFTPNVLRRLIEDIRWSSLKTSAVWKSRLERVIGGAGGGIGLIEKAIKKGLDGLSISAPETRKGDATDIYKMGLLTKSALTGVGKISEVIDVKETKYLFDEFFIDENIEIDKGKLMKMIAGRMDSMSEQEQMRQKKQMRSNYKTRIPEKTIELFDAIDLAICALDIKYPIFPVIEAKNDDDKSGEEIQSSDTQMNRDLKLYMDEEKVFNEKKYNRRTFAKTR